MHLNASPMRGTSSQVNPSTSDMSAMSERSTPVTLRLTRWRGPLGRAVLLGLAAALIALPAAANDATTAAATKTPISQVSLRQIAVREAGRTPLARTSTVRRSGQGDAAKQSRSFFKSRAGAVAFAVMIVGTGYAVYSAQHDRITSPDKK